MSFLETIHITNYYKPIPVFEGAVLINITENKVKIHYKISIKSDFC